MTITIGKDILSQKSKPYFIADIAANHDGDINRAYALIELAKEAGANAAKFQNFKARTIVSRAGFDSLNGKMSHQSQWEKSVYEVYEDASISDDWTPKLKEKCDGVGIEYMTSPYDFQSVNLADHYLNAYKIGSGDITWLEILEHIAKKNKPVIIATGASSMEDVERAVAAIGKHNRQVVILQCNTNYTADKENYNYINLNVLKSYKEKFPDYILGLSDHTFGHSTVLGAVALGARVIEKHFTDDNSRKGPDHKFSMNPKTWREMVDCSEQLFAALGDGVKKVELNEQDTVIVQRRAVYLIRAVKKGEVINRNDVFPLRPAKENSVAPYEIDNIIGKKINKDLGADTCLTWGDVE